MKQTGNMFVGDEYAYRLGVFLTNQRYVHEFNRAGKPYKLEVNEFSHLTGSEILTITSGSRITNYVDNAKNDDYPLPKDVPDTWDWRAKNVVTEPINQGSCGCCWACCTTAALESLSAIKGAPLMQFSIQQSIDCVSSCNGCFGCDPIVALNFIKNVYGGKSCGVDEYRAYSNYKFSCLSNIEPTHGNLTGYGRVTMFDEEELKARVSQAPCVACMKFSILPIFYYSSGIFDDEQCMGLDYDHGILIVGYGTEADKDFWIIKNSLGTSWGENGYLRLIRHKNMCGISSRAIYVY
jgi:cathepsin L